MRPMPVSLPGLRNDGLRWPGDGEEKFYGAPRNCGVLVFGAHRGDRETHKWRENERKRVRNQLWLIAYHTPRHSQDELVA